MKIKCDFEGIEITRINGEYLVQAWAINQILGLYGTKKEALRAAKYWSEHIL